MTRARLPLPRRQRTPEEARGGAEERSVILKDRLDLTIRDAEDF